MSSLNPFLTPAFLSLSGLSSSLHYFHSSFIYPKALWLFFGFVVFCFPDNSFPRRNCHILWDSKQSCFSLLALTLASINCFRGRCWLACCPRSFWFLTLKGCFRPHSFSLLLVQNHIFKAHFNTARGRIMRIKCNHLFFTQINHESYKPSLWQGNKQFP